jgi:hypothetical protein
MAGELLMIEPWAMGDPVKRLVNPAADCVHYQLKCLLKDKS